MTFYTLFLIHLKTQRIHIAGCTPNPDSAWVKQQARNFSMLLDDIDEKYRYVIYDRDNSFSGFDFILKAQGIKIVRNRPRLPCAMPLPNVSCAKQGNGSYFSCLSQASKYQWSSKFKSLYFKSTTPLRCVFLGPRRNSSWFFPKSWWIFSSLDADEFLNHTGIMVPMMLCQGFKIHIPYRIQSS